MFGRDAGAASHFQNLPATRQGILDPIVAFLRRRWQRQRQPDKDRYSMMLCAYPEKKAEGSIISNTSTIWNLLCMLSEDGPGCFQRA